MGPRYAAVRVPFASRGGARGDRFAGYGLDWLAGAACQGAGGYVAGISGEDRGAVRPSSGEVIFLLSFSAVTTLTLPTCSVVVTLGAVLPCRCAEATGWYAGGGFQRLRCFDVMNFSLACCGGRTVGVEYAHQNGL